MKSITEFKAFYCSGIFVPEPAVVTALSLLFEKIYLPNNIHIVKAFSRKYCFADDMTIKNIEIEDEDRTLFDGLNEEQKLTAKNYIFNGIKFVESYKPLMTKVFESQLLVGGVRYEDPILVKKGKTGEKNTYNISLTTSIQLSEDDQQTIPDLIANGYMPVVGKDHPYEIIINKLDNFSSKQMAALLAMQSLQLIFPRTKATHPEIILEARDRLTDHLPPFWSSMLKLSVELKNRIQNCSTIDEAFLESQDLIDTIVMPALIDLKQKMIKEKKAWFYKILSPVQKGLRLLVGNPPLTQQQLITNALILGSDIIMTTAENIRTIEALKNEAGLTFLLEASQALNK